MKVVRPRCTTEPPSAFLSPLYSQFMPLFLPFIGSKSFWHFPTTLSLCPVFLFATFKWKSNPGDAGAQTQVNSTGDTFQKEGKKNIDVRAAKL